MSKVKIFISHKRENGVASAEAILIHEILKQKAYYKVFMDVRENYIGEFPRTLSSKIKNSDVFVLLLPAKEVLLNKEGWVYKEIRTALESHEYRSKPQKILPITYSTNYVFPTKEELGEIKNLADYNIFYFDKNDPNVQDRLYKAIGVNRLFYIWRIAVALVVLLALIFGLMLFKTSDSVPQISEPVIQTVDSIHQVPEITEYVSSLSGLNSLKAYVGNSKEPTMKFLTWYTNELSDNKDIALNVEFNQAYVKQGIIRLTVLSYMAFTSEDLSSEQDSDYVAGLIEECYNAIPEDKNMPVALNAGKHNLQDNIVKEIIGVTIKTLDGKPEIKRLPEEYKQILSEKICSNVWPLS